MAHAKPWTFAITLLLLTSGLTLTALLAPVPFSPLGSAGAESDPPELSGQEKDVDLRLFNDGVEYLLTTNLAYGGGAEQTTTIGAAGGTKDFRGEEAAYADLEIESIDAAKDNAAHFVFWGSRSSIIGAGSTLEVTLRDETANVDLAQGSIQVDALTSTRYEMDLAWQGGRESYTLSETHRLVLHLENTGNEELNFNYDDTGTPTHLEMYYRSVQQIEISTEAYDLTTDAENDRVDTVRFEPNLPDALARLFVWGSEDDDNTDPTPPGGVLDSFGPDNIDEVRILIYREGQIEDPYFNATADLSDSDTPGWTNYDLLEWDYSSENLEWGSHYRLRVIVKDLQDNTYVRTIDLTMDQWGVYMWLPDDDPDGEVAVGGTRTFTFRVRNTGDAEDTITVTPSEIPDNWTVDPQERILTGVGPGEEVNALFTLTAPDDPDYVGRKAVIDFTASSEGASDSEPKESVVRTTTTVGAQHNVELYFLEGETQIYSKSVSAQIKKANEFNFTLANLGQTTDDFEVKASWPAGNLDLDAWEVEVVAAAGGTPANPYTVSSVPRKDPENPGVNLVELIVTVKPQRGGETETGRLTITATSQGNTSVSHSIYMDVTRAEAVALRPATTGGEAKLEELAGTEVIFELVLESFMEGTRTYQLEATLPPALKGKGRFTDKQGGSISDLTTEGKQIALFDYRVNLPEDLPYKSGDYVITLRAEDVEDSSVTGSLNLQLNLKQTLAFELGAKTTRAEAAPGKDVTFKLTIENTGDAEDKFLLSVEVGPAGWKVKFDKSSVTVPAQDSVTVTIRVEISDKALNGETEELVIKVESVNGGGTETTKFKVEVSADFGTRMKQTLSDNFWVFVLLIMAMLLGFVAWNRTASYDDDDEEEAATGVATGTVADDDFEDWD